MLAGAQTIKDGYLYVPTGPGWGTEVNEEAVRAHPPVQQSAVSRQLSAAIR